MSTSRIMSRRLTNWATGILPLVGRTSKISKWNTMPQQTGNQTCIHSISFAAKRKGKNKIIKRYWIYSSNNPLGAHSQPVLTLSSLRSCSTHIWVEVKSTELYPSFVRSYQIQAWTTQIYLRSLTGQTLRKCGKLLAAHEWQAYILLYYYSTSGLVKLSSCLFFSSEKKLYQ